MYIFIYLFQGRCIYLYTYFQGRCIYLYTYFKGDVYIYILIFKGDGTEEGVVTRIVTTRADKDLAVIKEMYFEMFNKKLSQQIKVF